MPTRILSFCTIEMLSTPAPMQICMPSTMICLAAVAIDITPDEHCRSIDWPDTVTGRPARSSARRAMLPPCTPCCRAQPITTSSTSAPSMPARFTAWAMAWPASVGDGVALNAPRNALPIGVRAVETITASRMRYSFLCQFSGLQPTYCKVIHSAASAGLVSPSISTETLVVVCQAPSGRCDTSAMVKRPRILRPDFTGAMKRTLLRP